MLSIHVHTSLINQALYTGCADNSQLEGHSAIKLFYYLKSLDDDGSGFGDLNICKAAQIFDRSCSNIRRWMRFGVKLGLFRRIVKIKKGLYRIYYTSVIKVCLKSGIKHLGEITELTVDELKNIKFHATEANAIGSQNKSLYAATKGKKKLIKKTLSAKNLCCKSKRILFLSDRFVYVNPRYLMYGASQEYIAKQSGYHKSTIQRRLSDGYRKAHGLKPVTKKQQCIRIDKKYAELEFQESSFLSSEGESNEFIFHNNKFKDLAFKPYTNIYHIDVELRKQRYLRAKLNREWAKKDEENQLISSANIQKQRSLGIISYKNKLLIKRSSNQTLHQITKSYRIKLLDWIKEFNFSNCKEDFKKILDQYLVNPDEIDEAVDKLSVKNKIETKITSSPEGRVI